MPELHVAAIISDMDGVLIDTGGIYDRHWESWAAENGVSHEHIATVHFGRPAVETIRLVAPHLDAPAEARRFNEALAGDPRADGALAMPGALDLVRSVPSDRWAIATSAPRVMALRWLAHVGIPEPAFLVTIDDVSRGKPAPDPYLRAAELLGQEARQCLVIEDAPAGITAARAAGAKVLAVMSTHAAADLKDADHVTGDLEDVSVVVEGDGLLVSWRSPRP